MADNKKRSLTVHTIGSEQLSSVSIQQDDFTHVKSLCGLQSEFLPPPELGNCDSSNNGNRQGESMGGLLNLRFCTHKERFINGEATPCRIVDGPGMHTIAFRLSTFVARDCRYQIKGARTIFFSILSSDLLVIH